jgi:hypothetical protein
MAAMKKKAMAMPKPKPTPTVKGKAAIKAIQKQTSKKGVASMEKKAQAALDKKYGWMK